jgi:hypothetical protein
VEIGELVDKATVEDDELLCPFCEKKPWGHHEGRKQDPSSSVKKTTSGLIDGPLPGGGKGKWTTAAHHLICAILCYGRLKPLVRMGSMVGYNINAKANGEALPTVCNPYPAKRWSKTGTGDERKLGDKRMEEADKDRVAFWVMQQTGKQWHVGSHSWEQQDAWDPEEFGADSEMEHIASYDNHVLFELYEIWRAQKAEPECEDDSDESNLVAELDSLSAEIRAGVLAFEWPYFVSKRAEKYANQ